MLTGMTQAAYFSEPTPRRQKDRLPKRRIPAATTKASLMCVASANSVPSIGAMNAVTLARKLLAATKVGRCSSGETWKRVLVRKMFMAEPNRPAIADGISNISGVRAKAMVKG